MAYKLTSKSSIVRAFPRLPHVQVRGVATVPFRLPAARNEPNLDYIKNSPERVQLEKALKTLKSQIPLASPIFINGQPQASTTRTLSQPLPAEHAKTFTNYPIVNSEQINTAIQSALDAKKEWANTPFVDRVAIFMRAAELVAGKYRYELIAATMLGQGKNVWQGEIDAAAELADFFRLNCNLAGEILEKQPDRGTAGMWTRVDYRPLEGFVYAISPFNFTAIGGNLVTAPAIMGNVVVWKPSPSNVYASSLVYKILVEAGLPPNVIQFVTGDAEEITQTVLSHREFGGLNFTGSSDVFRSMFSQVGQNIGKKVYRDYPRLVGETSGKNFHLVHPTADVESAVYHTIRAAFEYQGQKCSAASRLYLPESQADKFLTKLREEIGTISMGSPDQDLGAFMGPVIHRGSFDKIKSVMDQSNKDSSLELIAGGTYDDSTGFYVHPTVYRAKDVDHELFNKEVFGPVLVVYVYPDSEWSSTLRKVDQSGGGGFALTGAVFARDRRAVREAEDALRYSAGNLYINCKTTAALIGQQTFGGSRASGTNDKAGSPNPLLRFTSPRTIKEEFFPIDGYKYPSND